jgi:hypothetical protein
MKVALGEFACFCLASRFGPDLGSGIQSAARYYSRRLASQVGSMPRGRLPKRLERPFLEREAVVRSVDVQQLLNHAVFVYFAEIDRGV